MINQSFTVENLEKIYDIENRKHSITQYLGNDYKKALLFIKNRRKEIDRIKSIKKKNRTDFDNYLLKKNQHYLENIHIYKKKLQRKELESISSQINLKNFKFSLQEKENNIFTIKDSREEFFAIKQLQFNIRNTFKVKQSNRHLILSQIKLLLNDNAPKFIIRTDISKFFESIPQKELFQKIEHNTSINLQSRNFIIQILEDFNKKKNSEIQEKKGIPRGIGISSYLSELYLKEIDDKIKHLKDVIFYARYVDDIFIIISPSIPKKTIEHYFDTINSFFTKENLEIHTSGNKYNLIDLSEKVDSDKHHELTYLGYKIRIDQITNGTIETTFRLSENKKDKIEARVKKTIEYFNHESKYNIKVARKNLLLCLCFLTTNTKLNGAKTKIKTGIFYSNSLLDQKIKDEINEINKKFINVWLNALSPYSKLFSNQEKTDEYIEKLKNVIIERYSFKKGFDEKTFHSFSQNEFKTIKMILNEPKEN